jgi:hypothetical protein
MERKDLEVRGCDKGPEEVRDHNAAGDVEDDHGIKETDGIKIKVRSKVRLAARSDPGWHLIIHVNQKRDNPENYA